MRIVLSDGDVGNETSVQEGDQMRFDLNSGIVSFRRRGPRDGPPWIELAFSNADRTCLYEGSPDKIIRLIADTHCLGVKKIKTPTREEVAYEFT